MILPFFGILLVVGLFFLVEGWTKENQLFIWIGSLVLFLTGLGNFLNPLEIASGQITNSTGTFVIYTPISSWIVIPFSRILFWIGIFGLSFPIALTIDKNNEIKKRNNDNLHP